MIQQYNASRFRIVRGRRVGTIPVGQIVYVQWDKRPLGGRSREFQQREPWIITSWTNREYEHPRKTTYMTGGHLANVKSLRTGESRLVADWLLLASDDD